MESEGKGREDSVMHAGCGERLCSAPPGSRTASPLPSEGGYVAMATMEKPAPVSRPARAGLYVCVHECVRLIAVACVRLGLMRHCHSVGVWVNVCFYFGFVV